MLIFWYVNSIQLNKRNARKLFEIQRLGMSGYVLWVMQFAKDADKLL